jgi:hypothetical protein
MARMGESPATLAHHLGWLQLDLTDPQMHRALQAQAVDTRAWFRDRLEAAVEAGELLPSTDPDSLARTVEVAIGGAMLTWAFAREGSCREFVEQCLAAVLQPYLAGASRPRRRRRSK